MTRGASLAAAAGGVFIVLFIGALAFTGSVDRTDKLGHFEKRGIARVDPAGIVQVDLRRGGDHVVLRRRVGGAWSLDEKSIPEELADHIGAALNFISVSEPARALGADELKGVRFADFGLEPAAYTVSLTGADGSGTTIGFGGLNPVGVSQYARIMERPELYLLPRYIGSEWEVAAVQAQRLLRSAVRRDAGDQRPGRWLLSVSIDQIWSIDVAIDGKVHRLERDAAGAWLLRRSGQKAHAWSATSVAEPETARRIASTLDALEQTWIRAVLPGGAKGAEPDEKGFGQASVSALFYARDNSAPVAKFEIGQATDDRSDRFVRVGAKNDLFTVSADKADCLDDLLKSIGER
ncbi:MAG: hypothetical protein P4M07_18365 [Xanthobacteraceae bacterium]|nr:hypothetical protein [Xanthobacteraceae bacterium]